VHFRLPYLHKEVWCYARHEETVRGGLQGQSGSGSVKGEKTIAQIASGYSVYLNQVRQWRQHLLEMLPEVFSSRRPQQERARDEMEAELYRQIGQLTTSRLHQSLKEYDAPLESYRQMKMAVAY